MKTKRDILLFVIGEHVFARNNRAFADLIGHNQMAVSRLQKSGVTDDKVDELWEKLKGKVGLSDEELVNVACVFERAGELRQALKEEALTASLSSPSTTCGTAERMDMAIVAMCKEDYSMFSESFAKKWQVILEDWRRENGVLLYAVLTILFVWTHGADLYKRGCFKDELRRLIDELNALLRRSFAGNVESDNLAVSLKGDDMLDNIGCHTMHAAAVHLNLLMMAYVSPNDWMAASLDSGVTFMWGDVSWWVEPGAKPEYGAELWCLQCFENTYGRGIYNLYKARVKDSVGNIELMEARRVIFLGFVERIVCCVALLPTVYRKRKQVICRYEAKTSLTDLSLMPMGENVFSMPSHLRRIEVAEPVKHEDVMWSKVIVPFVNKGGDGAMVRLVYEDIGLELLDENGEFVIKDVVVSRKTVGLKIFCGKDNKEHTFEIDRDFVPLLRQVTPDSDVMVCRHHGDEEVYVEWGLPSFCVPLKAFLCR